MQRDLGGSLSAAVDAMFLLLPGLRAGLDAFVPPKDAPPDPPMGVARSVLAEAEALLTGVRDAANGGGGDLPFVPRTLNLGSESLKEWALKIENSWTGAACRPFTNAGSFAENAIKIQEAAREILPGYWRGNLSLCLYVWPGIGGLMWKRDDILVVTGGAHHSEGIRRRAQEALEQMGVKGGWWVNPDNTWTYERHEPLTRGSDGSIRVPEDLYADRMYDEQTGRIVLPEEYGHDMHP